MSQYSRLDTDDDPQSLSTQPLIANPDVLSDPTENVDSPEDGAMTGWIWLLTLTAGISGLLFGCEYTKAPYLDYDAATDKTDVLQMIQLPYRLHYCTLARRSPRRRSL